MTDQYHVLFVGGFSKPKDGTEGGQITACRSLVASPLANYVHWILIDSTQRSEPPPGILLRIFDALIRLVKFIWHLLVSRIATVFVFSSFVPLSILEKGTLCILGKLARKRVVLSVRSQPFLPGTCFDRLYVRYVRYALRCCTKIICQSQYGSDELCKVFGIDANTIEIVPNWIDTNVFKPIGRGGQHVSGRLSLVYVGWLHEYKGLEFLFQAIKILSMERQDFCLRLYGGGGNREHLVTLTKELEIESLVEFMGWMENKKIPAILSESDVFVFPSLEEGMPNSLLQAMACGCPVVTTNVSSIPEIVIDGENGVLVSPRSPEELAAGIVQLFDAPEIRKRMGRANQKAIRNRHSIDHGWRRVGKILIQQLELESEGTNHG